MELTDRQLPFELKIYMDEAGRWPLAGPVSVGTVIQTSTDLDKSQFADSKKLSPKRREVIYEKMCVDSRRDVGLLCPHTDDLIRPQSWSSLQRPPSLIFSVGFASAKEIDEYGIIWSLQMASIRSLYQTILHYYQHILRDVLEESVWGDDHIFQIVMDNELVIARSDSDKAISWDSRLLRSARNDDRIEMDVYNASLQDQIQFLRLFFHTAQRQFVYKWLYIDGNHTFGLDKLLDLKVQTIIKGDARNPMIGAASIAAKVERDTYMKEIDEQYAGWWLAKHKWYGTKEHREEIAKAKKLKGENAKMREDGNVKHLKSENAKIKGVSSLDSSADQLIPRPNRSGWQVALTPEHRITFLSRILSGESHK